MYVMDSLDLGHDFFLGWRAVNLVWALSLIFVLWWVSRELKGGWSNAGRTFVQAHMFLLFAGAWLSAESIVQDLPIGGRSVLVSMGLLLTTLSLYRNYKEVKGQAPTSPESPLFSNDTKTST